MQDMTTYRIIQDVLRFTFSEAGVLFLIGLSVLIGVVHLAAYLNTYGAADATPYEMPPEPITDPETPVFEPVGTFHDDYWYGVTKDD